MENIIIHSAISSFWYILVIGIILPTVVFNFEGGVDYELPQQQSLHSRIWSLVPRHGWIEGTFHIKKCTTKKNFHILYDNAQNTLSFMPAICDLLLPNFTCCPFSLILNASVRISLDLI
jgi:hypothetical protein